MSRDSFLTRPLVVWYQLKMQTTSAKYVHRQVGWLEMLYGHTTTYRTNEKINLNATGFIIIQA